MARRADHTRAELQGLMVEQGHQLMAEVGFSKFSAREVAKRIGYSIGTIYNVFGSYDRLILAINAQTIRQWIDTLEAALATAKDDRLAALVSGYFGFARAHRHAWAAVYDHRLPEGTALPEDYAALLEKLVGIVVTEVAAALPAPARDQAPDLARSLLASVHGHCLYAFNGTFARIGGRDPEAAAIWLVHAAINAKSVPPSAR